MATIYVSTSGDDNNDGLTPEFPKMTYTAAQSAAGSGGTVLGKRGDVWRERFRLIANITWSCYGDESLPYPEINGSDLISGDVFEWHQSANGLNEWYVTAPGGADPALSSSIRLFVDDIVHDLLSVGNLRPYSFAYGDNDNLGFDTFYIYSRTEPSNKKIEIAARYCFATADVDNVTLTKTRLTKSNSHAIRWSGSGWNIEKCEFLDCGRWMFNTSASSSRIVNNLFRRAYDPATGAEFRPAAESELLVANNEFSGMSNIAAMVQFNGDGVGRFLGNTVVDSQSSALRISLGTVYVDNNAFGGNSHTRGSAPILRSGGSVVWGSKNNILPSPQAGVDVLSDGFTIDTPMTVQPKFNRLKGKGFVVFSKDDYYNEEKPAAFIAAGLSTSLGLHTTDTANMKAYADQIQQEYLSGIEYTSHSRGHGDMRAPIGAFNIQYTGDGTCLLHIEVDYANRTGRIYTECSDPSDNIELDFQTYKRIAREFVNFDGVSWDEGIEDTFADHSNYTFTKVENNRRGQTICLEPADGVDITTATDFYFNQTNYLDWEYNGSREDFVWAGIPADEMIGIHYPFGHTDDDAINFLKSNGWRYGRTVLGSEKHRFDNIDLFRLPAIFGDYDYGSNGPGMTLEQARRNLWGMMLCADMSHGVYPGVFHPEYDYDLYTQVANEYVGDCRVGSFRNMYDYLLSKGALTDDNRFYYLREPDESDYRLRSDSDLKNAGDTTAVSGIPNLYTLDGQQVTDESGEVVGDVHIGAYGVASLPAPAKRRRSFGLGTPTLGF